MPSDNVAEKIMMSKKEMIGSSQAVVECRVSTSEKSIMKVLSINSSVMVSSVEVLQGEVSYQGKVMLSVVYMNEDSEINNADSVFPFSTKYESQKLQPDQKMIMDPKLVDVNIEAVDGSEVKIICVVESSMTVIMNDEMKMADNKDGSLCVKSSEMDIVKMLGEKKHDFSMESEYQTNDKIKKICCIDADAIIKSVMPNNNYMTVSGECYVEMMYAQDEDEMKLTTAKMTMPFKEEIEFDGMTKDSKCFTCLDVDKEKLTSTMEMNDSGAKITVNVPMQMKVMAFEEMKVETISDAYSKTNNILVTTESYEKMVIEDPIYCENKFEGSLTLSDDHPRIDKFMTATGSYLVETNKYIEDNRIHIEGIAYCNVIYLNDEMGAVNSVQVEMPYSVSETIASEMDLNGIQVEGKSILTDVDVMVKKGREIYMDAKVKSWVSLNNSTQNAVISSIEIAEELTPRSNTLEIYFAKSGQTLWDVAKDLKEDVETLMEQNATLPDVLTGEERIISYKQNKINFN